MDPQIPTMEIWTVMKWAIVALFIFGIKKLAEMVVLKWWYRTEKHDRRNDSGQSRGWIERFLENQREYTAATIALAEQMGAILRALEENGRTIQEFARTTQCKFTEQQHRGR